MLYLSLSYYILWPKLSGPCRAVRMIFCRSTSPCRQGYPAESIASVERQKVGDGLVMSVSAPAVDVNWLPCVARKAISEVERNNRWYCGVFEVNKGAPADLPANVVHYDDDTFGQEAFWEGDGGASFTGDDLFVIATALARLSMTVSTSGSEFANRVLGLDDEVKRSHTATAKAKKNVERQNDLLSAAEKLNNNASNFVASLRGQVLLASTREVGFVASALVTSIPIARATAGYVSFEIQSRHNTRSWQRLRS